MNLNTISQILLILNILFWFSPKLLFSQEMKPDLIISNVSARTEFRSSVSLDSNRPSMPSRYEVIIYTITITNIGRAAFNDPFYIAYTKNDFNKPPDKYVNVSFVNTMPKEIPVGGNIKVSIETNFVHDNNTGVRFLIQTDGKDHGNQLLPKIEELNYDNNTFLY